MNFIKIPTKPFLIGLFVLPISLFSMPNNTKKFFDAIAKGDAKTVQACLNQGISIEEKDTNGFCDTAITVTPLTFAILNAQVEIVRLLLDKGANVENPYIMHDAFVGIMTLPPLALAAKSGNLTIAQLLLKRNALVNAGCIKYQRYELDKSGESIRCENQYVENASHALAVAAQAGHLEIVHLLLNNNADVNAGYTDQGLYTIYGMCNQTALCCACTTGHTEIARLLLEKGAIIHDMTPLIMAINNENLEIVQLLIQYNIDINGVATFSCDGETISTTPLITAAKTGNVDMVQLLLDNGAQNPTGKTALDYIHEHPMNSE